MGKRDVKKILWVDDQLEALSPFVIALDEHGFKTSTAKSTKEAIKLAKEQNYDLFLVDIRMPAPDGIEAIIELHELQPQCPLAALSSYLYDTQYREDLRLLDLEVELIDKDIPNVEAPDFESRFIEPIRRVVKEGVTRTVITQDKALTDQKEIDPFNIELVEYMTKSVVEKDMFTDIARKMIEPLLQESFKQGNIWVLVCGADRKIRASAKVPADVLPEEKIMEIARQTRRAPFQFYKPVSVDDIWNSCGSSAQLDNYPTVKVIVKGKELSTHFDTGAPMTYFSYEDLLGIGAIPPTSIFIWAKRGERTYRAVNLNLEVLLKCQRKGSTISATLTGQAVRDWFNSPYIRPCDETCKVDASAKAGDKPRPCPQRQALMGRNVLTENSIIITLDGKNKRTEINK